MKKVTDFIEKYGLILLVVLIVTSTCSSGMSKRRSEKKISDQFDSLKTEIKTLKDEFKKEIKIEGLKTEKRMIQSTDRKIMDLQRQVEIDKELKVLDK
jgi:Tfp pilus assembly protein PilO